MENKPVKPPIKTSANKPRSKAASARTQLPTSERWAEEAIDVLAKEGVTGLRVEVLAKRCGVTKGSFYWHFKDRQALLDGVLEQWKIGRIRDIEKTTAVTPGNERRSIALRHRNLRCQPQPQGHGKSSWPCAIGHATMHEPQRSSRRSICIAWNARVSCSSQQACRMPTPKSRSLLLYACVFRTVADALRAF